MEFIGTLQKSRFWWVKVLVHRKKAKWQFRPWSERLQQTKHLTRPEALNFETLNPCTPEPLHP